MSEKNKNTIENNFIDNIYNSVRAVISREICSCPFYCFWTRCPEAERRIKYNVDFAVKKDKTTDSPKYVVFFKGRDADAVAQAFKEFVYGNEKRKSRTSVREKLKRFRDAVSQNKNRERSREKNKDRGQSL